MNTNDPTGPAMDNRETGDAEVEQVRQRYERRLQSHRDDLHRSTDPAVIMTLEERDRIIAEWIAACGIEPVQDRRIIEIGCGNGGNLVRLVRFGFQPGNMVANELLDDRAAEARSLLPAAAEVLAGDACSLNLKPGSFDIVMQCTVFTSILDQAFQQKLAAKMWEIARPGGGILWYDFIYNNPANPDVRGVSTRRIAELFPRGRIRTWRLTLAPPISRLVTRIHPSLYRVFNAIPALRTHVLCWIEKPGEDLPDAPGGAHRVVSSNGSIP